MRAVMRQNFEKGNLLRDQYAETMYELMGEDSRIILMEADMIACDNTGKIFRDYPERAIECGIQEANMIGVAAGMSSVGLIPFCHSFGPFVTRRVADQVCISAAYAGLNVKIIGSDPGITAQANGGTHMPFEDGAMMRSISGVTVLEPSCPVQYDWMLREMVKEYGVFYVRMERKANIKIYEDGSDFEIGKGVQLTEGSDVTIFATGAHCLLESFEAVKALKGDGISARLVDMFSWKPIDEELIAKCAAETGCFVTVENHNVMGGFGSAVAEVAVRHCPVPMEFVGVEDRFGQVGTKAYLAEQYGLTAKDIVDAARKAVLRKHD